MTVNKPQMTWNLALVPKVNYVASLPISRLCNKVKSSIRYGTSITTLVTDWIMYPRQCTCSHQSDTMIHRQLETLQSCGLTNWRTTPWSRTMRTYQVRPLIPHKSQPNIYINIKDIRRPFRLHNFENGDLGTDGQLTIGYEWGTRVCTFEVRLLIKLQYVDLLSMI
jgi:hypothetical protein